MIAYRGHASISAQIVNVFNFEKNRFKREIYLRECILFVSCVHSSKASNLTERRAKCFCTCNFCSCAYTATRQIDTKPQLSAVGRSEKTLEITGLCYTTWNVEQNPRCFPLMCLFNDFHWFSWKRSFSDTVSRMSIQFICPWSAKNFRLNTTYTKVTETDVIGCLILQLYSSSAEAKRWFRELWHSIFLPLHRAFWYM